MTTDTIIAAGMPTAAVIIGMIRSEFALHGIDGRFQRLEAHIQSLENRLDRRIETLDRDLREWARFVMSLKCGVDACKRRSV